VAGAAGVVYRIFDTARGPAAVAGGPAGLRTVLLPGADAERLRARLRRLFPGAAEDARGLAEAVRAVRGYFLTGRLSTGSPRLDLSGVGPFRSAVYAALRRIPRGRTVTYAELARRIGRPGAHRSVGTALSRNPLPLFVPCHRVVRRDGGLGGFTADGGLALKEAMLRLEGALPSRGE
jgi:methylated-DNA-[protein]-cysteine S-methyltransferase